jgi:hypothetical protein
MNPIPIALMNQQVESLDRETCPSHTDNEMIVGKPKEFLGFDSIEKLERCLYYKNICPSILHVPSLPALAYPILFSNLAIRLLS